MTDTRHNLNKFIPHIASIFVAMCSVMYVGTIHAASVVKRSTSARARIPVASTQSTKAPTVTEPETIDEPEEIVEETFEFEDRTSMFDDAIGGASASNDISDDDLAKMIRKQRESLNASAATTTATNTARAAISSNQNACDMGLRKCMMAKCGNDFAKCAGDTDTTWGDKMDTCRRDLKCSGNEYKLFANEIKADRDMNAQLANYNAIIKCGNEYNACIVSQCGPTYSKCLGKSAGDLAISKCKKIQDNCTQMDNGLASRTMNVFGTLRIDAEKQIQRDEQRLYDMRDEMESVCRRMGAMFDQRSLDCVYTVNFFANNSTTPYASKKAYAGGTFNCDPGWFGIDVTTFKENAYRLTAAQSSASAAMLGSGIGMAAGAISSGAINRAIDTQKAKKELETLEAGDQPDKKAERQAEREERKEERAEERTEKQAEKEEKKAERKEERAEKKAERQAEREERKEENADKKAAAELAQNSSRAAEQDAKEKLSEGPAPIKSQSEMESERSTKKTAAELAQNSSRAAEQDATAKLSEGPAPIKSQSK